MIRVFCVSILIFFIGFIGGFIGGIFLLLNKYSVVVILILVGFFIFCILIWVKLGILF